MKTHSRIPMIRGKSIWPMSLDLLSNPRQGSGTNGPIVKDRFRLASDALWHTTVGWASNV